MKTKYYLVILTAAAAIFAVHASEVGETDERIEKSAKKSYVFKHYLKDDSIKTESKNGVVVLTGTVVDSTHKNMAENTVESLPGVKSVDNRLVVKSEAPAEHSDGWVGFKVKSALLFHRNVSVASTEVSVKDGVVSLHGEASNAAQKELTGEYARDVEGVKEVNNEMTIGTKSSSTTPASTDHDSNDEKIDDASITAQVKSTLREHRSTSALRTKIQTVDGVVTLTGVAKNAAEKSLVTKLVGDVEGVRSVENNMTVEVQAASRN